jgi:hypothetical protein
MEFFIVKEYVMNKIQYTLSRFLQLVFILVLLFLPLLFVHSYLLHRVNYINLPTENALITLTLDFRSQWIMIILKFFSLLIQLFITCYLIRLFTFYGEGKVISEKSINYIRKIGYGLLAIVILQPITQVIMSFVLTKDYPYLKQQILLTITPGEVALLILGVVALLVSWILYETGIKEEGNAL